MVFFHKPYFAFPAFKFLSWPMHAQARFLYSSYVTHHCFYFLFIPLYLSLIQSSLLIHTVFLLYLLDFLSTAIDSFVLWGGHLWIINQLSCAPLPSRAVFHFSLPRESLNKPKSAFPKSKLVTLLLISLTCLSKDIKCHGLVVTSEKDALSLYIFENLCSGGRDSTEHLPCSSI